MMRGYVESYVRNDERGGAVPLAASGSARSI